MNRLTRFATRSPLLFCLSITVLVWLIAILAGVVAYPVDGDAATALVTGTVTLIGVGILLLLLRELRWLWPAGVTRLGSGRAWLLLLPLILYAPAAAVLAFFPDLSLTLPDAGVMGALGFRHLVGGGLLEELAFRSLVLYALVRVWGHTRRGLLAAIVISALFFSAAHLLHLLEGKSLAMVSMQVADTLLAGFVLAVFVLYARSIWPAVLIHASGNIAVNVLAAASTDFEETLASWILYILLHVPFYVLALYLLRDLRLQPAPARPEDESPEPGRMALG
jgi:membrane protease YdiL (CAAX protease family)